MARKRIPSTFSLTFLPLLEVSFRDITFPPRISRSTSRVCTVFLNPGKAWLPRGPFRNLTRASTVPHLVFRPPFCRVSHCSRSTHVPMPLLSWAAPCCPIVWDRCTQTMGAAQRGAWPAQGNLHGVMPVDKEYCLWPFHLFQLFPYFLWKYLEQVLSYGFSGHIFWTKNYTQKPLGKRLPAL